MFGSTYEFDTIRKYVVAFGLLFNNLSMTREDSTNKTIQTLRIPLTYGPKDKMLQRFLINPDEKKAVAIVNPVLGFELKTFLYDPDRKLNTLNKKIVKQSNNPSKVNYQYSPVPYNLTFSLYLAAKNYKDGTRVLEQILPKFTPDWEVKVLLIDETDQEFNTPIILNGVSMEDTYEGDMTTRRALLWTMNFTVKAYLFGPIRQGGLIKVVTINSRIPGGNDTVWSAASNTQTGIAEQIEIYPGLLPGGLLPTSNAALTIPWSQIQPDSNYGIITNITDFE